jgi:hypothetical protein
MAEADDESGGEGASEAGAGTTTRAGEESLPWYVKAVIVFVLLVIAFVLVVDLFEFAAAV